MLLNFLDQPYTKRWFFLAVPYLLVLTFASSTTYNSKIVYPNFKSLNKPDSKKNKLFNELMFSQSFNYRYYDDERDKLEKRSDTNLIGMFSLPSNKLKGQLGEVFIKGRNGDRHLVAFKDSLLIPFEEEGWDFGSSGIIQVTVEQSANQQQIQRTQIAKNINGIKQILQEAVLLSIDNHAIPPSKITWKNHPKHTNAIRLDTAYRQVPFIYLGQ